MYYALSSGPNEALDICVAGILFDVIRGLVRRIGSALDNDTVEVVDELPPEHRPRGEAGNEDSTSAQRARYGRHHIHPQGFIVPQRNRHEIGNEEDAVETFRFHPLDILEKIRMDNFQGWRGGWITFAEKLDDPRKFLDDSMMAGSRVGGNA